MAIIQNVLDAISRRHEQTRTYLEYDATWRKVDAAYRQRKDAEELAAYKQDMLRSMGKSNFEAYLKQTLGGMGVKF